ncbi:hypothetical protein PA598K_01696 [Paenibacillus sp. 598K]|uniref:alpha-mannosidase n=1 Tax=Paenibacillus sp. 598K TaxID=1117987 RepID=UPI000FFA6411|nr:glycosyl hydrolase-related protein [Paenibacillus sp. 598K]GBF73407.1 hypothetical protein PA598K_01696 [Paenibacillus sp. 598K]
MPDKPQSAATTKKTFHFVSHTHWDREWYLTFEQFRYRLVQLIDNLLVLLKEDPKFSHFHLDGQTIVMEDYLQVRPHKREELQRYIREGRILIGPWYEQNDLFLTSAESTVRNLIEGIRVSRALGGEMKVGYLPDHFGLLGQMPQIFRGVGLDASVFGRGYDLETHGSPYAIWRGADGSEVTGILMPHWYNNAQRLPTDDEQLRTLFEMMSKRESEAGPIPYYLMMNGVDHLEAQEDLTVVLDKLRAMYGDEHTFVQGTLPAYVQRIQQIMQEDAERGTRAYPVVDGELREGEEYSILSSTLSSRVYIKQANAACHDLLEKWMEPLSAWCALQDLDDHDADYMRLVWKMYMQNHPHDSICGCSADAVHDHMMDRYASIREIAEEWIDKKLTVLARQVSDAGLEPDDQKLVVVNTSQLTARSVIRSSIYFLAEDQVEQFVLEDPDGNAIPYRIVSEHPSNKRVLSPINLPGVLQVRRFDIEWQPQVPALSYITYRIRPHVQAPACPPVEDLDTGATLAAPVLENAFLRVEMQPDGTFHATNKATGVTIRGLGRLEDAGDRGDLYVHTPVETAIQWDGPVEWTSYVRNELYEACSYRISWALPAGLNPELTERLQEQAACEMVVSLRLDRESESIDVRLDVNNTARDHRLRLLFPLDTPAAGIWAGGQFDAVERAWDTGRQWKRDCNGQPFWKWVAALSSTEDRAGAADGLSVFARGLMEYEMIDEGRTLGLTLLRGVETINIREAIALEEDIQPKGQCLGRHTLELAVRPFAGLSRTALYQEAELWHQGVRTKQLAVNEEKWSQGRTWVQGTSIGRSSTRPVPNREKPPLPRQAALLAIDGAVLLSAFKPAEDGTGTVVRLYNVEPSSSVVRVSAPVSLDSVRLTNLLEEQADQADGSLSLQQQDVALSVGAKRIETLKLIHA